MLKSINPYNNQLIESHEIDSPDFVESELQRLKSTGRPELKERLQILSKLSDLLLSQKEDLSVVASLEMGKPIVQSRLEVEKCARVCRYYAENSEEWLKDKVVKGVGKKAVISLRPLGTLLAIMPWNFPYWQVFRVLAPQIALGNSVVLKHASNVTGCGLKIQELVLDAGGEALFSFLKLRHQEVSPLIGHSGIQAVTLTGSTAAGKSVAIEAGKHLKKSVLELGGSDPYILLADADLSKAVSACVRSRTNNSGQSCIAAKRFIVHKSLVEEFTARFVDELRKMTLGDPLKETTQIGPLAKKEFVDDLKTLLQRSQGQVDMVWKGEEPEQGAFFAPTVVRVKDPAAPVFQEETFGPLAAVISVDSEEEALSIARNTSFGLGGAIFTEDLEKGWRIAREELRVGSSAVNTFVQSHPELPFGGVEMSGYGRELGEGALSEFANVKSIVLN